MRLQNGKIFPLGVYPKPLLYRTSKSSSWPGFLKYSLCVKCFPQSRRHSPNVFFHTFDDVTRGNQNCRKDEKGCCRAVVISGVTCVYGACCFCDVSQYICYAVKACLGPKIRPISQKRFNTHQM